MTDAALDMIAGLVTKAQTAGADAADAVRFDSASLAVARRMGKPEKLERAESADIGLRVFVGKRQAIVSSTDLSPSALDALVERGVAMARAAPEDPNAGLAESSEIIGEIVDLDLAGGEEPTVETLTEIASRAEDAARAVPGVTNSEGAEAGWDRTHVALVASNGFTGAYTVSHVGLSAAVLAGEGTAMERDYDYATAFTLDELTAPETIGKSAGERAVQRLNPRRMKSARMTVVYDPRASRGLLSHLAGAINGAAIARQTSFLKDRMGEGVFSPAVTIIDDPTRKRGLGSKPFDGEGVGGKRRALIDKGILTTWLLDCRSARQLGLASTGHASRSTSGPPAPAPTNLYMEAGDRPPAALIGDVADGIYVTELIGMGVNTLTGDYSRGAAGFRIENGEITDPVSEITIAGGLADMFARLVAADDLELRYGINAPTVVIEGMTIAGN